jgi:hypothetical protein
VFLALFFCMTMPIIPPARFVATPEYHMPGRDDLEPGTNALVTSGTSANESGTAAPTDQRTMETDFFGEDGMTFADLLDVVNPLQHIPIVSDLYRAVSGDEISAGARMAGGTLYGGALGFVGALANTMVEEMSGKDIGGNVLALFSGDGDPDGEVQIAGNIQVQDDARLASLVTIPRPWENTTTAAVATGIAAPSVYGAPQAYLPLLPELNLPTNGGTIPMTASFVSGQATPELSTAAFHTLLKNVNGTPKTPVADNSRQGLAAGGDTPQARNGTIREAGLEVNRLLRAHTTLRN